MTEVYRRKRQPPDWPRPNGLLARDIDGTTGLLKSAYCPITSVYTEWYIPGTEPVRDCDLHTAANTVRPGVAPAGPPAPPQPPQPPQPATGVRVRRDSVIANPFKLP